VGTAPLAAGTGAADAGSLVATLDVALLEPTPFGTTPTGQMAPGSHTVYATFTGKNPNFTINDPNTPLTITAEDASVDYNGDSLFYGASTTATSATVTLTALVTDAADVSRGDIRNSTVKFVDRATNTPLSCSNYSPATTTLVPSLVDPSDPTVGIVVCTTTLAISNSSGSQYTIGTTVNNYYTRNSSDDDTVITVADPLSMNFITGGGYLVNPAATSPYPPSAGTYAGDVGRKTNFGFNVKYNKGGTNLQGNVNIIVRKGTSVYQFKSNSLNSLNVTPCATGNPSPTCPAAATFVSKANGQNVTNPAAAVSLGGNLTLQMTLTDNGEPGSADTLAITVWNGSTLWFSSSWSVTTGKSVEQLLKRGNLAVH
jgi:hypothetical protein